MVVIRFQVFRVENLFSKHIHAIHDADDDGIHGRVLQAGRQARGAALAEQHHLALAAADAVHGHNGVGARTELRRVLFVHQLRAQQQQLAARHVRVFLGGHHRAFDSRQEHNIKC